MGLRRAENGGGSVLFFLAFLGLSSIVRSIISGLVSALSLAGATLRVVFMFIVLSALNSLEDNEAVLPVPSLSWLVISTIWDDIDCREEVDGVEDC